ncbi:methyltransferase [Schaalia sp. Marseille-Q2122]|uniref:methyltransferase n=1 Tax=Schaalia sp. Marseille-Q2122 TaxID=2736604 RepID=UPI00158D290B|nr:methyltransferase [Schaalia sp. Marseille-Q2122]
MSTQTEEELRLLRAALRHSQQEQNRVLLRTQALEEELADSRRQLDETRDHMRAIRSSLSWRITFPLRILTGRR